MKRKTNETKEESIYDFENIFDIFNEECRCELKPIHKKGEHDWCCQICGGQHSERLCPHLRVAG